MRTKREATKGEATKREATRGGALKKSFMLSFNLNFLDFCNHDFFSLLFCVFNTYFSHTHTLTHTQTQTHILYFSSLEVSHTFPLLHLSQFHLISVDLIVITTLPAIADESNTLTGKETPFFLVIIMMIIIELTIITIKFS